MKDNEQSSFEAEPASGAAPAHRQCRYVKADGKACRDWAIRGQDYCHRHDVFLHARPQKPIDVPLLEDESSIVLLLSETLRALAWGTIPVSDGRMLLAGCRLAHTMHFQRLEMAKLRLRAKRMGMSEDELFGTNAEPEAESQWAGIERGAPNAERDTAPGALNSEPEPEPEPLTTPIVQPPNARHHSFRDLKKNWDKELSKVEIEMTDMFAPRHEEDREDFLAARATPFDHLEAQERELARVRAEAKALAEAHALTQAQAAQAASGACLPAC